MIALKRIIIHWTGGASRPCADDLTHYHYIIDKDGKVFDGKYKPEDNENCKDGKYAAHTGGGNTGSIGVSMCGMYVPQHVDVKKTQYPLTKVQCERCFKLIAELCKKYSIVLSRETVLTHYEFGLKNPRSSSAGKIDITYLPPYPEIKPEDIGDFIRNKSLWYFSKV